MVKLDSHKIQEEKKKIEMSEAQQHSNNENSGIFFKNLNKINQMIQINVTNNNKHR